MFQKRIKLALYLEGIRIPVVSAMVSGGTGQPATASIQILPDPAAHDLLPRTLVHLFFFDFSNPDAEYYKDIGMDEENEGYKLLFWGDLIALQHQQTANSHSIVLQCVGVSSYWEQAKQYFKDSNSLSSANAKRMAFLGTDVIKYDGLDSSPASTIIRLLTTRPVSNPGLQGLLGGCVHLLEGIGGIYKGPQRFKGLNDFFAAAELRLRLSQNIWASPNDNTSTKMFKSNEFKKWIKQAIRGKGGLISFGGILGIVLGAIQHEFHSMLAPRFKRADKATTLTAAEQPKRTPKKADSKYFPSVQIPEVTPLIANTRTTVINLIKNHIPVLDKLIVDLNPTRTEQLIGVVTASFHKWNVEKHVFDTTLQSCKFVEAQILTHEVRTGKSVPHWKDGNALLEMAIRTEDLGMYQVQRVERELHKMVANPNNDEKWRASELETLTTHALSLLEQALEYYKKLVKWTGGGGKSGTLDYDSLDRLIYMVFTPQIYFVSPPTCNVIFPEQRVSMAFTRNFATEITRLQVTMHDSAQAGYNYDPFGSNKHVYYAPNVEDVLSKKLLSDTKKGTRVLMPHEIYSGIVPDIQQMTNINVFGTGENRSGSNYLQRAANFLFFQRRLSSRTMTVAMGFNPYLASGFPALIIDRPVPMSREELELLGTSEGLDKIKGQRLEKINMSLTSSEWDLDIIDSIRMPVHYFGQLRTLTHSITPGGAHTQCMLAFCRTHDEKMEFLGSDEETHKRAIATGTEILGTAPTTIEEREKTTGVEQYTIAGNAELSYLGGGKWGPKTESLSIDTRKVWNADPGVFGEGEEWVRKHAIGAGDPLKDINTEIGATAPYKPPDGVKEGTGRWVRDDRVDVENENLRLNVVQRESGKTANAAERQANWAEYDAYVAKYGKEGLRPWRYERTWTKYEEYKVKVPPELALMPSWFAQIYRNENIGPEFYKECIGVGSITDPYVISVAADAPVRVAFAYQDIAGPPDPDASMKLSRDLDPEGQEKTTEVTSIEHAANLITLLYSAAKEEGVDVDQFIRSFTWRPVASLIDMFGTEGLWYIEPGVVGQDEEGYYVTPDSVSFDPEGEKGFHEYAFSAKGDMFGLIPADPTSIVSGTTISPDLEIDKRIDPRPARHRSVMRYFMRLLLNKSLEE